MPVRKRNQGSKLIWFFNEMCRISDVLSIYPGVAVPEGEAHRHEPPIPHDEVMIDTRKNNAELEEDKKQPVPPAGGGEEEAKRDEEQGVGHAGEVKDKKDNKVEEKQEAVARKEEVDLGGGEVVSNEVLEKPAAEAGKKRDVPPPKKAEKVDPVGGNVVDNVGKSPDAAGKREYLSLFHV